MRISPEMTKLADTMVAQIKKDLGIHSPSLVMRWHGQQAGRGFTLGLADMEASVASQAGRYAHAVTGMATVGGVAASGASRPSVQVNQTINPQPYQSEREIGAASAMEFMLALRR